MSKIVSLILLMFAMIGFSSCSKTFTCACTFSDATKNFDVPLEDMRKNDATVVCNDYSVFVGNCKIK